MRSLVLRFLLLSLWGGAAALGAWAACAVLRRCHAPSRLLCWLWLAVGLRFALPGGIPLALPRPRSEPLAEAAEAVQGFARSPAAVTASPLPAAPAAGPRWYEGLTVWHLLFVLWLAGVAALALRALWGYARLRRGVATAYKTGDGCFGGVPAPFTLGILRPRIYLPDSLTGPAREAVRLHEQTHIRRGDPVTKPLYYAVVCLHWFNPLAWLAFRQFERTMESACDEAAVRGQSPQARALYCESLLAFALQGRTVPGSLAFGQGSVKERIGHLLRYRRLGAGALALCVAAVAVCTTACMMQPTVESAASPETAAPTAETAEGAATDETAAPAAAAPTGTLPDMAGAFLCPVPDYTYISRHKSDSHRGDDLCATRGADIVAAADGIVQTAGWHYSYGYYVILTHDAADGHRWRSLYSHMLEEPLVAEGETVTAGQVLGAVGSTGNATGNHCHFELYRDVTLMEPRYFTAYKTGDTAVLTAQKVRELEEETANALAALSSDSIVADPYASVADSITFWPALQEYKYISCTFGLGGHPGVDFSADEGTPVYAVADGIVADAGYDKDMGYYLRLNHGVDADGKSYVSLYTHLRQQPEPEVGTIVDAEQLVGYVGSTGTSTGNHLHLELLVDGENTDPLACIPH